jgi:hypothetical protein
MFPGQILQRDCPGRTKVGFNVHFIQYLLVTLKFLANDCPQESKGMYCSEPGNTFPPNYRIFNLLCYYTNQFTIYFPAVNDVFASAFALAHKTKIYKTIANFFY